MKAKKVTRHDDEAVKIKTKLGRVMNEIILSNKNIVGINFRHPFRKTQYAWIRFRYVFVLTTQAHIQEVYDYKLILKKNFFVYFLQKAISDILCFIFRLWEYKKKDNNDPKYLPRHSKRVLLSSTCTTFRSGYRIFFGMSWKFRTVPN